MVNQKDVMNELYTAAVITAGVVGISYASKKITKDSLGVPPTLNGAAKLAVAIGLSTVCIKALQDKSIFQKNHSRVNKIRLSGTALMEGRRIAAHYRTLREKKNKINGKCCSNGNILGAGFLFKSLDENGYKEEMKRHNLAMEKLTAAKEKWYENQVKKKNEMELLRQQLSDANADIITGRTTH